MITQQRLKEVLIYDQETGEFTRIYKTKRYKKRKDHVGYKNDNGYLLIRIDKHRYRAHHLAWLYVTGKFPKEQIDHINLIRDDNRFCNLRECSNSENSRNSRKKSNNTSGFKGVHFNKTIKKWQARARANGKRTYLGSFDTVEKAAKAYEDFVVINHGVFARLN